MSKSKFYVVWEGKRPGIYTQWSEAEAQIKNYPDAKFKSFPSRAEAEFAFKQKAEKVLYGSLKKANSSPAGKPQTFCLCVDAACSGNPGILEYRGLTYPEGKVVFHQGPFPDGSNNIGEFLAIVHALALLKKKGDGQSPVYTDSITALSWVRKKKCNSKIEQNAKNEELFELVRRAENWLQQHSFTNPLYKWDTEKWGEIPADFGRK